MVSAKIGTQISNSSYRATSPAVDICSIEIVPIVIHKTVCVYEISTRPDAKQQREKYMNSVINVLFS